MIEKIAFLNSMVMFGVATSAVMCEETLNSIVLAAVLVMLSILQIRGIKEGKIWYQ